MNDKDMDKNPRLEPEDGIREETGAIESDELQGAEPDERDFAEEASTTPATAPASAAAKPGMPAWPWVGVSVVATAALAFVLIANPLGKTDDKIGTFDGGSVTKTDFYDEIKLQAGSQFSGLIDGLIEQKLIKTLADKAGISPKEDEIAKAVDKFAANYGGTEQFKQVLEQNGIGLADFEKMQIVPQLLEMKLYADQHPAKEEDFKAYFEANEDLFATSPKQVKASHILVDTKEEADAILADLKAGKDFATLAKQKSKDTGSAANGGELGDFFGRGEMVAEFEEAAFKLNKGELSEPIQSDYGYHIIKVTDVKEAVVPPYEEKKADVEDAYWNEQLSKNKTEWLDKLKEDKHVKNLVEEKDPEPSEPAASEPAPSPTASASSAQ